MAIKEDLKKIPYISGSKYQAKIAIIKDYDNEWDGEQDKWHGPLNNFSENGWLSASQFTHTPLDFLFLQSTGMNKTTVADLRKYELLVYPHATILTEDTATLLKSYVSQGGKLIMGARTGYKDEYGRCPMRPMPGFAGEICGVRVSDYTNLGPDDDAEYAVWDGELVEAPVFNDILEVKEGARVLATFKGNYYDGAPALVANDIGQGTAYYFGAGFSVKTAGTFLKKLGFIAPYSKLLELPEETELAVRSKDGKDYIFVLNYKPYSVQINLKQDMTELISGKTLSGKIEIEKFGVVVFEK